MTLKERVIVEVYTGKCMVTGNDRDEVYKYMREIMGRPVYSHELADKKVAEELRTKSLADFAKLCSPPATQADRIRAMTDEELLSFLDGLCACPHDVCRHQEEINKDICKNCTKEWLQSPVEVRLHEQ